MLYHLAIFGKYMPQYKDFFPTYEEAMNFVDDYITKYFPTEYVYQKNLYQSKNDMPFMKKTPQIRAWAKTFTSQENSYHITIIDETICKKYRKIFLVGKTPLNHYIINDLKKFYNNKEYNGNFKLQIN